MWAIGLGLFIAQAPYPDLNQLFDNKQKTDAIVIFTGGTNRLSHAIDLYKQGLAPKILISGVYGKNKPQTLLKHIQPNLSNSEINNLSQNISLDYLAENTVENAIETAHWIKKNQIKTIRLVTSIYHMPRSMLYMRYHLNNDITIIPEIVVPDKYTKSTWWKPRFLKIWMREYNKFLLTYTKLFFKI